MEKRVRRAREKFDAQLADVEASERAMLAKCVSDETQPLTRAPVVASITGHSKAAVAPVLLGLNRPCGTS